jgi:hypothetical protein
MQFQSVDQMLAAAAPLGRAEKEKSRPAAPAMPR